jgi:hypothetical protein
MKLKSGDMLIMFHQNGVLKLQVIGRDDTPRVEREGRGWSDGATAMLNGADVAELLDALGNSFGEYDIGDSGLSMKVDYNDPSASGRELPVLVLTAKKLYAKGDVSARLTWPERTLLMYAVRDFAWKMFM